MKIGVLTISFNERDLIRGCIEQFDERFDHLVLVSRKPWYGPWEGDDTFAVVKEYKVASVKGDWKSEAAQRNYGLEYFRIRNCDWVIICDADERYTKSGLDRLLEQIFYFDELGLAETVRTNNMEVYWKTPDYRISPQQMDCPVVAIRPLHSFERGRRASGRSYYTNAKMHHFSYVRSNKDMLKKVQSFDHAIEFDPLVWYEDVWATWTPESENLHPVVPAQFKRAIWHPCPQELKGLLP